VIDNSGVNDLFLGGKVNIFPNPADNQLNVSFNAVNNASLDISLTDISGRVIVKENHNTSIGENKILVDLSEYTTGIYFLKIADGNSSMDFKVVVK